MNPLRIIFLGTADFAVGVLKKLIEENFQIVAVVTAPDKPQGRGKKLGCSPVKKLAMEKNLTLLQPIRLKDKNFLTQLKELQADLQIVVAFRMLPKEVWQMPPLGTMNLHASMLPQYRGAAPIHWAIINGEKQTGLTTFFLKHEIDTGNILLQEAEDILETDNVGSLYQRLMDKGSLLVVKSIEKIASSKYVEIPQNEDDNLKQAPKIFREDCEIIWNWDTIKIKNFVRGLNPFPVAWTWVDKKILKIYEVEAVEEKTDKPNGTFKSDNKTFLHIYCENGYISLKSVQLEGKKRMEIEEFLRGFNKFNN